MKHRLLLSALMLAVPAGASSQDAPPDSVAPRSSAVPALSSYQESVLDSVRADMEIGRNWRATRRLRGAFPEGLGASEELTLLLARAEAGWNNWPAVRALLEQALEGGELDEPEAWYLLGRSLEHQAQLDEAETAFGHALGSDRVGGVGSRLLAQARRALIRGRLGRYGAALEDARALAGEDSELGGWVALELGKMAAAEGAREETRRLLSIVRRDEVRQLGWDLLPEALLASGDSIGAEAAFWSSLPSLSSPSDQADAWDRVGALRLVRGDSAGARGAFHQVLSVSASGAPGVRSAENLLALGFDSAGAALAGARALARGGRHTQALDAYGLYEEVLGQPLSPEVRLAVARSHLNLGQGGRALPLVTELAASEDPDVAPVALNLKVSALRQLGRSGEARASQDELIARFPGYSGAVEIAYGRADGLRNRGNLDGAIAGYETVVAMDSSHNRAGQARMWMGQLLLRLGRPDEARAVYSAYLDEFPDGRRADEAMYWLGRTMAVEGLDLEGRELLGSLPSSHPISYYTVRAGELLGESFDPPLPEPKDPLPFPNFLEEGLGRFDRLLAAGLESGAAWEFEEMAARVRRDPDLDRRLQGLLRLAHEMNSRGFTREGINLGWEVRREERPLDRHLLKAIYPFPYRDIVLAEALERGIDPFLMAGLIRQESAFWAEARSRADARGLMQVLPSTGRELARTSGPAGFRPDDHLYVAEVNIHLGMAFFADMRRRFGQDLPIILSAYNAGPSRALRWRQYPEARDMHLFVERIPFTETRGYVKNVLANRAIYAWLYGQTSNLEPRVPHG
ncbi:MAG: transglycosylase SLT domain-containing protein [Gemmatimonadetes bacterium]|nr:transglycosylase SLT domain-containing protein [Gemmatimonadota bacterium]NNM05706.1 transglycosylase SLT domain-containing protein [Gemmatimonadota bacterium]